MEIMKIKVIKATIMKMKSYNESDSENDSNGNN